VAAVQGFAEPVPQATVFFFSLKGEIMDRRDQIDKVALTAAVIIGVSVT